ncbi:MAG: HU family DNA-binding protein [Solirubrobacteraceae bacterium]|nr:HU family DNA-binding protein [Solirubrobacteraceae bacterium]
MTKAEFTEHVARKAGLAKADAAKAVDAMLQTVEETLARGSDVTFSGFGKFHVTQRAARQGVHPRTGERITIAASRAPRFTPGSGLRRSVAG